MATVTEHRKAVVFGGAGFLGSHVADELTAAGFDVTIFDLRESSWLSKGQRMVTASILDKEAVAAACKGCDYVYNFAGLADINEAKHKPLETAESNIMGNLNVLEGCRAAGVKRFIFASTVYVFSESGSFYRASKQASERFTELYFDQFGLRYTILRYGSLYGRRADGRNSIHRFVHEALTRNTLTYAGTGNELREYIHVLDAAKASLQVLGDEFENQHVTITGHSAHRVRDVANMISEMLGHKVRLIFEDKKLEAHYEVTPYAYKPRPGKKLVTNPFVDFGQGVLDCIHEVADSLHSDDRKC